MLENAPIPTTTPALQRTQGGASVAPAFFAGDQVHVAQHPERAVLGSF
jgi:hypothetical protein